MTGITNEQWAELEAERDQLAMELDESNRERDAMEKRARAFEAGATKLQAERDALAAHVERLDAFFASISRNLVQMWDCRHQEEIRRAIQVFDTEMGEVKSATPATWMDAGPSWQELRHALHKLQLAESTYRQKYHRYGGDSLATGQAWDNMRRAGHHARELLMEKEERL